MIVVLGRPLAAGDPSGGLAAAGLGVRIAIACAALGASVELAGTVGDDSAGGALAVALARHGVGHAALLRIASVATPRAGDADRLPGLEAPEIDLALRYLPECRVLVIAEPLSAEAERAAIEAAAYHGAAVVGLVADSADGADGAATRGLAAAVTMLLLPLEPGSPFAELVARYAVGLDAGQSAAAAFDAARRAVGWEPVS